MIKHLSYSIVLGSLVTAYASYSAQLPSDSVVIDIPEDLPTDTDISKALSDYQVRNILAAIEHLCCKDYLSIQSRWQKNYDQTNILPDEKEVCDKKWYKSKIAAIYNCFDKVISENNPERIASEKRAICEMENKLCEKYNEMKLAHDYKLKELVNIKHHRLLNQVFEVILLGGFVMFAYTWYRYDKEKDSGVNKDMQGF